MAPNSLSPASVVISYHSLYSPHKMTIPTRQWFPTSITGALGSYENWTGIPIDAEVMVRALVDKIKVLVPPSTSFDEVTAYTQLTPTSANIPQKTIALGIVGTSAGGGNSQAVSATMNCKTDANGTFKLVILEPPIGANWFAPIKPADFTTPLQDIFIQVAHPANAWSGRDDHKPQVARSMTFDLNDKLQKMYWGS
jgi:hypothetical protein